MTNSTRQFEKDKLATDGLSADQWQDVFRGLVRDVGTVSDRNELDAVICSCLSQRSNAAAVFRLANNLHAADADPQLTLLFSKFEQLPANLESWAVNVGMRSIVSNASFSERTADANVSMVGAAICGKQSANEAIVVVFLNSSESGDSETSLLQTVALVIEQWEIVHRSKDSLHFAEDSSAAIEFGAKVESAESIVDSCKTIADNIASYLTGLQTNLNKNVSEAKDPIQVFVASTNGGDRQINLEAHSLSDQISVDSKTTAVVESAMGERLSRQVETLWPALEHEPAHSLLCHARLAKELQQSNLFSLPMHDRRGDLQGVILVASNSRLTDRQRRFCDAIAPSLGSTVALVRRAESNRLQRMLNRIKDGWKSSKFWFVAKCSVVVFALSLIPVPYKVGCDCEVQPLNRRFVCAPFESQLFESLVEPGDIVTEGQLIAKLDEREIAIELAENDAELLRARKTLDGHLVAHESGESRLAQLEASRLTARNQLLSQRVQKLEMHSPIKGIVVAGDLENAIGMPLERGHLLYEIAPLNELVLEVLVPDSEVRFVKQGMPVKIQLDAVPFQSFQGTIERLQPSSQLVDNANVFVAKVRIDNPDGKLLPGMQGRAKVSTVWRPFVWTWTHKPAAQVARWFGW